MPKQSQKQPKPLPTGTEPQEQPEMELEAPPDAPETQEEQSPEPERQKTPLEVLVEGIQVRRQLSNKDPSEFPPATRPGLVSAQQEARDSLTVLEGQYAQYLKQSAVATILTGDPRGVKTFLTLAQEISVEPLVVLEADAMYRRLAIAAEPGLGDSRQFGSGQVGLIIEEFAAIGKELYFTSLASPNWVYDLIVKTQDDLVEAIRTAIRTSKDGDVVNRSFLRVAAFHKALELGYTSPMVPVVVTKSSPGEVEFLTQDLFDASVLVQIPRGKEITPDFVKSAFKAMVQVARTHGSAQRTQSVSL